MDFYQILTRETKKGPELFPDFIYEPTKDLMVRGRNFYAIWDEERQTWSMDEFDVQRLVDKDLYSAADEFEKKNGVRPAVASMKSSSSGSWDRYKRYLLAAPQNFHPLDSKVIFSNHEITKEDYATFKLPYPLEEGPHESWDELTSVLYNPGEKAKIEWAIGAVVAGDSKWIQKFMVFYGSAGTGKSTILGIIERLFQGYTTSFDAKALGSRNNNFALEPFKNNPLVAIQHDGDLSKIEDNTKLNSLIAHEAQTIDSKYQSIYSAAMHSFLFIGTNQPVKITDAKSGIIRRLIDIVPTGHTLDPQSYRRLMSKIEFELGAIAYHCLSVYKRMGSDYYNDYRPELMMLQTDVFYNYIEYYFDQFKEANGVTLKQAYTMYKQFCDETGIQHVMPQYRFREELRNYFEEFHQQRRIGDERLRSYFEGFKHMRTTDIVDSIKSGIELTVYDPLYEQSIFDIQYADQPAQYAKDSGFPGYKWDNCPTTLKDIKTEDLHFVKVPSNHIVIDFDLVDEDGEKSLELNLAAADKWPTTYTEVSKSGKGVHLHYIYHGDVEELASVYDVGIEVKTLLGDSSLRRKLTKFANHDIALLTGGLPVKEKRPVLDNQSIKTEKGLRDLIDRNLRKEIHPGTKPSVDFIHKILEEAYEDGLSYDVTDMRSTILTFAAKSSNQSSTCIKLVKDMKFKGKNEMPEPTFDDAPVVFFDVEVYPNLFVVCWKPADKPQTTEAVAKMVNPSPQEIEKLFSLKLVGFNNRRYDNHILYGRYLGLSNEELYRMSQRIISNDRSALYGEAYNLSYADIYDFSSKKQGLKKFEIELDILHMELDIPWDEPVDESLWDRVVEYCTNDVLATEQVFNARHQDFVARQILADLSGLSVNHTTQAHTAKIIFGADKNPQDKFVYTDLSEMFPGYTFHGKESHYRGDSPGEGGYVYAEPGIYSHVALLDVASMHPTSIEQLGLFGPYTKNFSALKEARMAIKHRQYDAARQLLDGRLRPFLDGAEDDEDGAEALSYALKIVINIVYGLTSAKFDNPFRDIRNVDNIVAKRGALFMIDLKLALQEKGVTVAHIKTDSVKIPNANPEIIDFVVEFGKKYGYDFEHEATYERFCLVNDAVYIARSGDKWTAVGAQFQIPYVYKTLFSGEPIEFSDICETKNVTQGTMYIDKSGTGELENMTHLGRTGSFVPVLEGGGELYRVKDGKKYAVSGTKRYRWITRDEAASRDEHYELFVDMSYFEALKDEAIVAISKFGSFEEFVS